MTERELARGAAHRLAIIRHAQEVSGSVAKTCRYYGISRNAYYKWFRRYEEFGEEGLRERSKRPHHMPQATHTEVVGKILYLRQSYHFGPQKISMYLKRYHDIEISNSGVWRSAWGSTASRPPSATSLTSAAGSATRSLCRATASRWTSSSSPRWPVLTHRRSGTTSSPPSTTARGCGCCGSMSAATRRARSSSSITWPGGCPSPSTSSRRTTVQSSARPSTGTSWTRASTTSTSSRRPRGSTEGGT